MYDTLEKQFPDWDTEKALDLVEIQWGYDTVDRLMRDGDSKTLACLIGEAIKENPELCRWE